MFEQEEYNPVIDRLDKEREDAGDGIQWIEGGHPARNGKQIHSEIVSGKESTNGKAYNVVYNFVENKWYDGFDPSTAREMNIVKWFFHYRNPEENKVLKSIISKG